MNLFGGGKRAIVRHFCRGELFIIRTIAGQV